MTGDLNSDSQARLQLAEIAEANDWNLVVWHGHFSKQLVVLRRNEASPKPEVYSAIYESYFDLFDEDLEVKRFRIDGRKSWKDLLDLVNVYVNER